MKIVLLYFFSVYMYVSCCRPETMCTIIVITQWKHNLFLFVLFFYIAHVLFKQTCVPIQCLLWLFHYIGHDIDIVSRFYLYFFFESIIYNVDQLGVAAKQSPFFSSLFFVYAGVFAIYDGGGVSPATLLCTASHKFQSDISGFLKKCGGAREKKMVNPLLFYRFLLFSSSSPIYCY